MFWITKEKKMVSIDDMDANHAKNILKMIIKSNKDFCYHCNYIVNASNIFNHLVSCPNYPKKAYFRLNGEMANMFNDDMEFADNDQFDNFSKI